MSYQPTLSLAVDWNDATFTFAAGGADAAWAAFTAHCTAMGMLAINLDTTPPAVMESMARLFVDGVRSWSGVLDANGGTLQCTKENRQAIPFEDKIAIVATYLQARQAVDTKEKGSGEPPISSMDPAPPVEA